MTPDVAQERLPDLLEALRDLSNLGSHGVWLLSRFVVRVLFRHMKSRLGGQFSILRTRDFTGTIVGILDLAVESLTASGSLPRPAH